MSFSLSVLFLTQSFLIIVLCRIIHWPLSLIRQPRVIAEVISGILLGPSVMGHVPNFTSTIFPPASIPGLNLVATVGLVMFLFIVGMEVDLGFLRKNMKVALTVGVLSMVIPFGLGFAVAKGLYDAYAGKDGSQPVSFGVYGLFIGVAMAITAFPVLARILTETRLIRDRVGVIVLSAGIGNDLVGWILLALTVTLANASKAINTLYIILLVIAWTLVLTLAARPGLKYYLKRSGNLESGPSQTAVSVILLLVFLSAFYTDIIGVHPIFGAFMIGMIVPREHGFVIKLTEKIEDFITVILIPQYFAIAGLNTNLGLLNDGTAWGYVIAIIVIALTGKIVGGSISARLNGLLWRESLTVGILMSCKGIVEIVVLQVGLQAQILSQRVFSMFVVMALVATFLTTPLALWAYPIPYRQKVAKWRAGEINWDGTPATPSTASDSDITSEIAAPSKISRIILHLDDVESISLTMTLMQLLTVGRFMKVSNKRREFVVEDESGTHLPSPPAHDLSPSLTATASLPDFTASSWHDNQPVVRVRAVRLVEFSQRTADLIQVTTESDVSSSDPALKVLQTFSELNKISFSGQMAITTENDRASYMISTSSDSNDVLLTTWDENRRHLSFDSADAEVNNRLSFVAELFESASCQVVMLIDRGFSAAASSAAYSYQNDSVLVYVPIFSTGKHDRLALGFALHLARYAHLEVVVEAFDSHLTVRQAADDKSGSAHYTTGEYLRQIYQGLDAITKSRISLSFKDSVSLKDVKMNIKQAFGPESSLDLIDQRNRVVVIGRESDLGNSVVRDLEDANIIDSPKPAYAPHFTDYIGEITSELIRDEELQCSFLICSGH